MSDHIPFEIQMEIVKRVPVKSLFQFRSISKSWKSLIDSPQFIADYNACQSRPQRLLIRYEDDHYPAYKYQFDPIHFSIVDDDDFPQHKFATSVPNVFPQHEYITNKVPMSSEHLDELRLVGSSQGLVCLLGVYRDDDDSYWEIGFIWNPAIRKSIAIDVPVLYPEMYWTLIGFGVCPNTNEPMLVRVNDYDEIPSQVDHVFTLSSKVWRRPYGNLPHKSIGFMTSPVTIHGFIYWRTFKMCIVSFDMITEEFEVINLPRSLARNSTNEYLSVCELRESLAVLQHYNVEEEKPVCDVWMMDHGVSKSFTKVYTVTSPNACLMKVLGFRKNGQAILETKTDSYEEPAKLEVYDPGSKFVKDLGIYGEHGSFFVSSYTESLLLLDQADNQRIHGKFQS